LVWAAELLAAAGHDVRLVPYQQGAPRFRVFRDPAGQAADAWYPRDADVLVFQRVCERDLADLIRLVTARGVAVVVDVDDYLSAIHPTNPAWVALHPRNARNRSAEEPDRDVSFRYVHEACAAASLVTVTTPALIPRYAPHGRVQVLPNFLPDHYYDLQHQDSQVVGWPASYFSHPGDPAVTHGAIGRLVREGHRFVLVGDPEDAGAAFGLEQDPPTVGPADLDAYPGLVARALGVGIAPLASTVFGICKSWLKPLELSACGVPWVGSPTPEYARLHQLGAGLLAKDKGKDWYRQLRRLLDDPVLRADLSQAGREVAAGLRLRDHAQLWLAAWTWARDLADQRSPSRVAGP
jgi:glycosyltransferase involved in cell wall biosynthesis